MNIEITYNLKKYRIATKLTQEQLSELSGVGIATISDIENNKVHPTVPTICILAIVLNININKLINQKIVK